MSSREIIRMLEAAGFQMLRQQGSHQIWGHPDRATKVTVPHPKKDLPKGTALRILKDAGLQQRVN